MSQLSVGPNALWPTQPKFLGGPWPTRPAHAAAPPMACTMAKIDGPERVTRFWYTEKHGISVLLIGVFYNRAFLMSENRQILNKFCRLIFY